MVNVRGALLSRDVVLCLCRYIHKQANQPPPKQTSVLHSKIAGAYRCLQTWVMADSCISTDPEVTPPPPPRPPWHVQNCPHCVSFCLPWWQQHLRCLSCVSFLLPRIARGRLVLPVALSNMHEFDLFSFPWPSPTASPLFFFDRSD